MNDKFPGLPDYTGPTSGVFFAVHHEGLCERSSNVMKRVDYILSKKPAHEQSIRLANLMYLGVVGENYLAQRASLDADYQAKRLYADYQAKRAALDAELLVYVRSVNPACAWDEKIGGLSFIGV